MLDPKVSVIFVNYKTPKMTTNAITFNSGNNPSGLTLGSKTSVGDSDIVFYEDHYVTDTHCVYSQDRENGEEDSVGFFVRTYLYPIFIFFLPVHKYSANI